MLSKKLTSIQPSLTLGISSKAKALKAEGVDVVGFGAGEPDFDTPDQIKHAAIKAIAEGHTKYTPSIGIVKLREEISRKFKKDNDLAYEPGEIVVAAGAKYIIFEILMALLNEGEEVIIPAPYWLSYPEMVKVAGGVSIFVDTSKEGFKLTPDALKKAITKKTKVIILNYPSNPTGATYSDDELKELAEIIVENDMYCISDEIYEKLIYSGKHTSIASLSKDIKKKTVVVNGVSKAYSMTGWRIGYAAGDKEIMKTVKLLQDHSTSNPCSIAQYAALEAIKLDNDDDDRFQTIISEMVGEFKNRRDFMVDRVNSIKGCSAELSEGAFYCFVNISKAVSNLGLKGSLEFCDELLEKQKVAAVPGVAFGNDDYIRLSYATSLDNIKKGLDRIEKFVS